MNNKITNFFKATRIFLGKHSPEILTGCGLAGMVGTTILAVQATPKAIELIEKRKEYELTQDENFKDLTKWEIVKTAWKPYIPAISLGIVSVSCIIGANTINVKRNAALATAYAISEKTLIRYRDKVIDTIGEKKEKEIREQVAQDEIKKNPVSNSQVIITSRGNTLCRDAISGRYFRSDIDKIKRVVHELNRQLTYNHYVSLEEFYYEIGLDPIKNSSILGWNLDDGIIELDFSSCLTENDEPCVVIDYNIAPRYEYDKLM